MDTILLVFWFLVGVLFSEYVQLISDRGSFTESIFGRSHCDSCKKELPWYSLIPFIGAAITGFKCQHCGKNISKKYFWFELLFSATWAWSLFALSVTVGVNSWIIALALFTFCATSLIMYEDAKHYSVPMSWLIVSQVSLVALWFALGHRVFNFWDVLILLAVVLMAVGLVQFRRRDENLEFGSLFGSADLVAFLVAVGLLGFNRMTVILSVIAVSAVLFLFAKRKLKGGQKIPLLTLLSPLVYVLLLTL